MVISEELSALRKKLDEKMVRRNVLIENREQELSLCLQNSTEYENCLKARAIVQEVAKDTQKMIEYHIGNLVSLALAAIFPQPYTFALRFVERRNVTEADLIFSKNDNETDDILNTGGGGVADMASFALRPALWSLKRTRETFLLDEPGKFLHNPDYQEKASQMMKGLCSELGIQIIMISDQENMIAAADKVIRIVNRNGTSEVLNENVRAD
jgi:DNA repair exonuclease SbcCD ATPase subunit